MKCTHYWQGSVRTDENFGSMSNFYGDRSFFSFPCLELASDWIQLYCIHGPGKYSVLFEKSQAEITRLHALHSKLLEHFKIRMCVCFTAERASRKKISAMHQFAALTSFHCGGAAIITTHAQKLQFT